MYGMVVMMALTSGAENPDFGKRNKGCHGCCGGGYVSCYGGCCGGGGVWYGGGCCGGGAVWSGGGMRMGYGGLTGDTYYSSGYEGSPWMGTPSTSGYYPADSASGSPMPAGGTAATVRIRMPAD